MIIIIIIITSRNKSWRHLFWPTLYAYTDCSQINRVRDNDVSN